MKLYSFPSLFDFVDLVFSLQILQIVDENILKPDLDNDVAIKSCVDTRVNLRATKRNLDFYLPLNGSEKMKSRYE